MGLRDIAERAGVSIATVSRFLRDRELVSVESRRKIEQALGELQYPPQKRKYYRKRDKIIVLFVPDIENPFFASTVKNMDLFLSRMGYLSIPCNMWENGDLETRYLRLLKRYSAEGILLIPSGKRIEEFLQRLLKECPLPVVVFDRRLEGFPLPFVGCDNHEGGKLAAKHLLQMGRRNIAFIAGKDGVSTSAERLQGYKEALEEAGFGFRKEFVIKGDFSFQSGFEAGKQILAMKEKIDGVFAANDFMALGLLECFKRSGVRVPDDISVVGYDDIWAGRVCEPPLTTVRQPISEMCEFAANAIVRFAQGEEITPFERVFKPELVVRGSSYFPLEGGEKRGV
jgi:LacI family transcriptional regulator